jgi:hypothetical protein
MDDRTLRNILAQLKDLKRLGVRYRQGEITNTDPLSVALGGSSVPYVGVTALDVATLRVGDTVSVLTFAGDLLVLGRIGGGHQEDWHIVGDTGEPAFTNGWSNLDGTRTARFFKDSLGEVHLEGYIDGGTIGQPAFTLPAGYRPGRTQDCSGLSNGAFGLLQIGDAGTVNPYTGSNVNWSLFNVHFRAEL